MKIKQKKYMFKSVFICDKARLPFSIYFCVQLPIEENVQLPIEEKFQCLSNALRAHIHISGHFMDRLISFNF